VRDLVMRALDTARQQGAAYADVRIVRLVSESITARNENVESLTADESLGFGVRVIVDGYWGFASSYNLTLEEADRVAAQAVRVALDQGLHSCQYWWASCRPWWDTGMIERGAALLLEAVRRAAGVLPPETLRRAEGLHDNIVATARRWQEGGQARRLREAYLREHPQVDAKQLTFSS